MEGQGSYHIMLQQKIKKKIRCLDCIHCNEAQGKCFPESKDCGSEYDLDNEDLYVYRKYDCDFFENK